MACCNTFITQKLCNKLLPFHLANRVIDRSLSAMNGCKGKGKNLELQVTMALT